MQHLIYVIIKEIMNIFPFDKNNSATRLFYKIKAKCATRMGSAFRYTLNYNHFQPKAEAPSTAASAPERLD